MKPTYATTVTADGRIRYWDVYQQQWQTREASDIEPAILATLSEADREIVRTHRHAY